MTNETDPSREEVAAPNEDELPAEAATTTATESPASEQPADEVPIVEDFPGEVAAEVDRSESVDMPIEESPAAEPAEVGDSESPESVRPVVATPEAPADLPEAPSAPVETEAPARPAFKEVKVIAAVEIGNLPDEITSDFEAALEHTVIEFKEGDIVEGTVVSVDPEGAMVDIGYKSEGLIPIPELSIKKNVDPTTVVTVGERVEALVLTKEDDEGRLILSKKRAQYERAWGRIRKITDEGGTVTGPVIEVVKGGLIVDIGLRGFLPASLVDLRRVRDLDPYVGEDIEAKVIELDRNRNNVVLSRRAFLEEAQAEQRQAFLDDLAVGEVRESVVSSVVPFGAFVDLGGMDGLVHVSELSWQHVNHPSEVVNVGDKVTVKVLEVDLDRERISLSIKQTLEDPWVLFSRAHGVGDKVSGVVTKTVPFGAFVSVGEGVEGLVHVSEIAIHRVESPELELSLSQAVEVKITEMDDERRRVSLSIKQALPEWQERKEREPQQRGPVRREFEREVEEPERPPVEVNASLEAILAELKERGIGRR